MSDEWFDSAQAMSEGWAVFDSSGSTAGDVQIQRLDEEAVFDSDQSAWTHVLRRANEMSIYHVHALRFAFERNELEKKVILDWAETMGIPVPEELR